jgi:hypothetical protein
MGKKTEGTQRKTCSSVTRNPTWKHPGLKPRLCCGNPASSHLSSSGLAAIYSYYESIFNGCLNDRNLRSKQEDIRFNTLTGMNITVVRYNAV